jgi:hypothetical protein
LAASPRAAKQALGSAMLSADMREREPFELRLAAAHAVGDEEGRVPDAKAAVHDLLRRAGGFMLWSGLSLKPHEHLDLCAEDFLVKVDRLVGAASKKR